MTTIIGVRFKSNGKMYYFDPQGLEIAPGTGVIVETARGVEYGDCVQGNTDVPDQQVVQPLKRVVRVATETDMKTLERNKKRQIGVRDEAKMIGGLGCCGRELCCSSYLDDFHPVSINMAKDQNLSLNPAKISGVCGRLMCCLKYEHEAYAELQKVTPRQGSVVDTPEGRGKVISTQMLRGTCKVQLDDSPEHSLTEFQCTQCCMVKGACRNRQNAAAMAEERRKREDQEDAAAPAPKKDAPKKSETPHQKPQQPRPPRKPAPQQTAGDELPEDAQNELSPDGEGAPRRRRRRGGRRRRKPNGENGAPEQNSGEE